jgi:phosphate transport system ATP-binding protein
MASETKIRITQLWFWHQSQPVLKNVSVEFKDNTLTAIVGPSGIGKSTFLTTLNRLWEDIPGARIRGTVEVRFNGMFRNIYDRTFPLPTLRRLVGMVFQAPNPLPMSIFKNVAFPLKLAGKTDKELVAAKVENSLRRAYLWREVKNRLNDDAATLSGGQQQRLCIARALVMEPEILLLDEPTSSLDSKAASVIEELLLSLRRNCTLIVVSHYLDQVSRIADRIVLLAEGRFTEKKHGDPA